MERSSASRRVLIRCRETNFAKDGSSTEIRFVPGFDRVDAKVVPPLEMKAIRGVFDNPFRALEDV